LLLLFLKERERERAERQLLGTFKLIFFLAGEGHAGFEGINYEQLSQVLNEEKCSKLNSVFHTSH